MDMVFMILHNSKWFGMCISQNIPQIKAGLECVFFNNILQIKAVWNVHFTKYSANQGGIGMCFVNNIPQIKAVLECVFSDNILQIKAVWNVHLTKYSTNQSGLECAFVKGFL